MSRLALSLREKEAIRIAIPPSSQTQYVDLLLTRVEGEQAGLCFEADRSIRIGRYRPQVVKRQEVVEVEHVVLGGEAAEAARFSKE